VKRNNSTLGRTVGNFVSILVRVFTFSGISSERFFQFFCCFVGVFTIHYALGGLLLPVATVASRSIFRLGNGIYKLRRRVLGTKCKFPNYKS